MLYKQIMAAFLVPVLGGKANCNSHLRTVTHNATVNTAYNATVNTAYNATVNTAYNATVMTDNATVMTDNATVMTDNATVVEDVNTNGDATVVEDHETAPVFNLPVSQDCYVVSQTQKQKIVDYSVEIEKGSLKWYPQSMQGINGIDAKDKINEFHIQAHQQQLPTEEGFSYRKTYAIYCRADANPEGAWYKGFIDPHKVTDGETSMANGISDGWIKSNFNWDSLKLMAKALSDELSKIPEARQLFDVPSSI